jgi:hypothetical protein
VLRIIGLLVSQLPSNYVFPSNATFSPKAVLHLQWNITSVFLMLLKYVEPLPPTIVVALDLET